MIDAAEFLKGIRRAGIEKRPRFQSAEYLDYIHQCPCVVRFCQSPVEANHTMPKGSGGRKASDILCLPMCEKHHKDFHKSIEDFESDNRLNLSIETVRHIEEFLDAHGLASEYKHEAMRVNRGTKVSKKKEKKPYVPYEIPWLKDLKNGSDV